MSDGVGMGSESINKPSIWHSAASWAILIASAIVEPVVMPVSQELLTTKRSSPSFFLRIFLLILFLGFSHYSIKSSVVFSTAEF